MRPFLGFLIFSIWTVSVFSQTPPPRKAVKHRAATGNHVQQQPSGEKENRSGGSAGTEATHPSGNQQNGSNDSANVEKPFVVSQLPEVAVRSVGRDWATTILNVMLVIVGGLQVWILCRTVRWMKHQSAIMRGQLGAMHVQARHMDGQLSQMKSSGEQTAALIKHAESQVDALNNSATAAALHADAALIGAKAAKASADALVGSERPWVTVIPDLPDGLAISNPNLATRMRWSVKNVGRSPAIIHAMDFATVRIERWEDLPHEPRYPGKQNEHLQANGFFLIPNDQVQVYWILELIDIRSIDGFTEEDISDFRSNKKMFIAYGFVQYFDTFQRDKVHTFRYCTRLNADSDVFEPAFGAPESYTKSD